MGNWLQGITEWVSDAIPNEFSKLNNSWVGNIPYLGWAVKGLAAADNFSETYSNSGDLFGSVKGGMNGIMGVAQDPNLYSEKNQPGFSNDWALNLGKVMNLGSAFQGGNYSGAGQQGLGMLGSLFGQSKSDAYAPAREGQPPYMDMPQNAGIQMAPQVYNFSDFKGQGGYAPSSTEQAPWSGVFG